MKKRRRRAKPNDTDGRKNEGIQLPDQPGLLRDRDELTGKDEPAVGVLPARERFHTDGGAARELNERLVPHHELGLGQHPAQLGLGPQPRDAASPRLVVEEQLASGPEPFASYMAVSASRSTVSGVSPPTAPGCRCSLACGELLMKAAFTGYDEVGRAQQRR